MIQYFVDQIFSDLINESRIKPIRENPITDSEKQRTDQQDVTQS